MTEDDLEKHSLDLIGKAQVLYSQAIKCHDKKEKARLRKEARNFEKLAEEIDTMKNKIGETNGNKEKC